MFTGIVETFGEIVALQEENGVIDFVIKSNLSQELKIDQSVAHNGVCLTVIDLKDNTHTVTAVDETLQKTTLSTWNIGTIINLERAVKVGDRLDGHIVQGHVDTTAICKQILIKDTNRLYQFVFDASFSALIIEKGSICVNGVSLTLFDIEKNSFWVTIIPYTFEHTTFNNLKVDDTVNLEFDLVGKYLTRKMHLESTPYSTAP